MPDDQASAAKNPIPVSVGPVALPDTAPFNEAKERATGAREVARVLVFTFAATIGATFIIIALIYFRSSTPAQANEFVKHSSMSSR